MITDCCIKKTSYFAFLPCTNQNQIVQNTNFILLRQCRISKQGNLVHIELNDGASIEPDDVGEIYEAAKSLDLAPAPGVLIAAHMPFQLSAAAREMAAQMCADGGVKGVAVYSDVTSVRVTVNFFNRINRPQIAVRVFEDQALAETWLNMQGASSTN